MLIVLHIKPQPAAAMATKPEPPVGKRAPEGGCAGSRLRETCLSDGVPVADLGRFDNIIFARRLVKRGQCVFDAGDAFTCLYSIRSGFFKTSLVDRAGREQVTGFFMGGDLLGLDGLACGRCESYATALEDSEVCTMPYALLEGIARQAPSVQRRLHSLLAHEILRGHAAMLLLGSMCAEERLASFLLNLSGRYLDRGFSGSSFRLRMTRNEMGSYLGLKLETVSRLFSAFHRDGLLEVRQKEISIRDIGGLQRVLTC